MHFYSIEFRIYSKKNEGDLDLNEITTNLGLMPTNIQRRGERRSASSTFIESMWGYETFPGKDWNSLEEGLDAQLKVLMPLRDKIDEYIKKYDAVWWCGLFTSDFDAGPTFSSGLLKKLGDFGVELSLSAHCVADEEQPG